MDFSETSVDARLSAEWLYLTNEAYAAERFGVRALSTILRRGGFSRDFSAAIESQISDEIVHTRGYADVVRVERLPFSSFACSVEKLLNELPNATLQLFALQGVVEGLNLGLLRHRLERWKVYPSKALEEMALADEERHTANSYDFMNELKQKDGVVLKSDFDGVTRRILAYFAEDTLCKDPSPFLKAASGWRLAVECESPATRQRAVGRVAVGSMWTSRQNFLRTYSASEKFAVYLNGATRESTCRMPIPV